MTRSVSLANDTASSRGCRQSSGRRLCDRRFTAARGGRGSAFRRSAKVNTSLPFESRRRRRHPPTVEEHGGKRKATGAGHYRWLRRRNDDPLSRLRPPSSSPSRACPSRDDDHGHFSCACSIRCRPPPTVTTRLVDRPTDSFAAPSDERRIFGFAERADRRLFLINAREWRRPKCAPSTAPLVVHGQERR